MSVQLFLPLPWVAADGYDTLVVSTARRNEPNNIPPARSGFACDTCGACLGTKISAHLWGPCKHCGGTGIAPSVVARALRIAVGLVMLGVIAWGLGSHPAIVVTP